MNHIYQTIFATIPAASSLICMAFLLSAYADRLLAIEKYIKRLLLIYFGQNIVNWFFTALSPVSGGFTQYLFPFTALNLQLIQVTYFHVISIITSTDGEKRNKIGFHYVIPFLLCLVVCIFLYSALVFFPSREEAILLFKPYLFISVASYAAFYNTQIILSIWNSYKSLASEHRINDWNKLKWLKSIVLFKVLLLFVYTFLNATSSYQNILYVVLIPIQQLILIYNVLLRNYIFKKSHIQLNKTLESSGLIVDSYNLITTQGQNGTTKDNPNNTSSLLSQVELETYFRKNKPYLDPHLKMEDLVTSFTTNRAYFSKFINQAYGVNFSNYINIWRIKELNSLQKQPEHRGKDLQTLITMAGFGSTRNYWRVKKKLENKSYGNKY